MLNVTGLSVIMLNDVAPLSPIASSRMILYQEPGNP